MLVGACTAPTFVDQSFSPSVSVVDRLTIANK